MMMDDLFWLDAIPHETTIQRTMPRPQVGKLDQQYRAMIRRSCAGVADIVTDFKLWVLHSIQTPLAVYPPCRQDLYHFVSSELCHLTVSTNTPSLLSQSAATLSVLQQINLG